MAFIVPVDWPTHDFIIDLVPWPLECGPQFNTWDLSTSPFFPPTSPYPMPPLPAATCNPAMTLSPVCATSPTQSPCLFPSCMYSAHPPPWLSHSVLAIHQGTWKTLGIRYWRKGGIWTHWVGLLWCTLCTPSWCCKSWRRLFCISRCLWWKQRMHWRAKGHWLHCMVDFCHLLMPPHIPHWCCIRSWKLKCHWPNNYWGGCDIFLDMLYKVWRRDVVGVKVWFIGQYFSFIVLLTCPFIIWTKEECGQTICLSPQDIQSGSTVDPLSKSVGMLGSSPGWKSPVESNSARKSIFQMSPQHLMHIPAYINGTEWTTRVPTHNLQGWGSHHLWHSGLGPCSGV